MAFLQKTYKTRSKTRQQQQNETDTIQDATAFLQHENRVSHIKKIEFKN